MAEMTRMTSLLDLMHAPPMFERPDPYGSIVQGDPDEKLTLPHSRNRHIPAAEIELHRHTDGRWMWSVSYHFLTAGRTVRVGPKWGKFAASRHDALYWAARELLEAAEHFPDDTEAQRVARWAKGMA